ncbi:acyltransferase family protein [Crocinitomix catalasitica]|uniref:acyltransferase family protein n=1 Tax=Crocinitomix catalasitica TaxID=184607 RepID=UPI0004808D7B|nr:acyltransferase [Crocinitomix catalasitica]
MKSIFFKGLNEIRAIAAVFVVFHHIELYKHRDGLISLYDTNLNYFISHLGKNGVYIFFVLSGFLITYLLLSEKSQKNKIDIRKFYFRRILRIWPLYYLIVFFSFVIIPFGANYFEIFQNETHYFSRVLMLQDDPYLTLLLFVLFLPNLALMLKPAVVGASQSWSVGVEEQFYIVWPHLVNKSKNKFILLGLFFLIAIAPIYPILLRSINLKASEFLIFMIKLIPIHFMAIGGIGGFLLFYYRIQIERVLNFRFAFLLNTMIIIIFFCVNFNFALKNLFFAGFIMIEILFVSSDLFKRNLRNYTLDYLGKISYGIYMYHPLIMYICFALCNEYIPKTNLFLYNIAVYGSIFIGSILISKISFIYFEKWFIDLKNKNFTVLKSGSED